MDSAFGGQVGRQAVNAFGQPPGVLIIPIVFLIIPPPSQRELPAFFQEAAQLPVEVEANF